MTNQGSKNTGDPRAEARALDVLVGKNIQKFRQKKNLTQKQLGDRLGLTFQQIQKYENATNRVSGPRLYMLSQALEVPLVCFFDERRVGKPSDQDLQSLSAEAVAIAMAFDRIGKSDLKKALGTILKEMKS